MNKLQLTSFIFLKLIDFPDKKAYVTFNLFEKNKTSNRTEWLELQRERENINFEKEFQEFLSSEDYKILITKKFNFDY